MWFLKIAIISLLSLLLIKKTNCSESFNLSDYDEFYNENFDSQLDELFLFGEGSTTDDENTNPDELEENSDDLSSFDFVDENEDFVPFVEHDDKVERLL